MFLGGIAAAIFSHVFDKEWGSWPWWQSVCFIGGAASQVATGRSSGYLSLSVALFGVFDIISLPKGSLPNG
jgi:hypothetical protein